MDPHSLERATMSMEEKLARMTPSDFAYIIGMALAVMIIQMLWGWREPIMDYVQRFVRIRLRNYVTRADEPSAQKTNFPASRPEVEAEAMRKEASGSDDGMVVLTQKALQAQLDDATRDGMIRAFASIYRSGYLVPGKVSAVKQALFGVSGGRKLQGLNAAIDAVVVPPPSPEPIQTTPLAGRPVPAGLRFTGELIDEEQPGK